MIIIMGYLKAFTFSTLSINTFKHCSHSCGFCFLLMIQIPFSLKKNVSKLWNLVSATLSLKSVNGKTLINYNFITYHLPQEKIQPINFRVNHISLKHIKKVYIYLGNLIFGRPQRRSHEMKEYKK